MQHGGSGRVSPARRRFQAFYVGLPKTGSTSMASIFRNYRTAHEFLFQETVAATAAYQRSELSREQFIAFLRKRDAVGMLEMDASTFNFAYLDLLIEVFPGTRFIFVIRDCYSWLDSLLDMSLRFGAELPQWMLDFPWPRECVPFKGITDPRATYHSAIESAEHLSRVLPQYVGGFLDRWGKGNRRTLSLLPPGRSLVLRTHGLSASLPRLARFLEIPPDTISDQEVWVNRAALRNGLLSKVDRGLVESCCRQYCQDVMDKYFPGYRFTDYLDK